MMELKNKIKMYQEIESLLKDLFQVKFLMRKILTVAREMTGIKEVYEFTVFNYATLDKCFYNALYDIWKQFDKLQKKLVMLKKEIATKFAAVAKDTEVMTQNSFKNFSLWSLADTHGTRKFKKFIRKMKIFYIKQLKKGGE